MKVFIYICLLISSAQAASTRRFPKILGVDAYLVNEGCGEVGGHIFYKFSTREGIRNENKLVCYDNPKFDEIAKEYDEIDKEYAKQLKTKSDSRIGQEDGKIYKCKKGNKYLYCNNDHFYEEVGPVVEAQLSRPSMDIFNNNRPKDKATDQFNKDKGIKNPSIIER